MKHFPLSTKRNILHYCCYFMLLTFLSLKTSAQVKVGDNPNSIKNASLLELESTNKGVVMPRVSLTGAVTNPAPLAADILPGTIVYNTNAAFTGGVGLQIWTGTTWMVVTPSSLSSSDAWKLTGNSGTNPATHFIGTTDAQPLVFKVNGQKAGYINSSTSSTNTSLGYQALNVTTGNNNTAMGYSSMLNNTTGNGNTALGVSSLRNNNTGSSNTSIGWNTLNNSTGDNNTANGAIALQLNTTGANNTGNGAYALKNNTTGANNTANGYSALINNTSGNNNTAIGIAALISNTTGTNNIAIGNSADVISNNLTNATAIGYNAKAAISHSVILGNNTDNVKVGIGTSSPSANLHAKGTVRFEDLTNGVLTADASGNLSTTTLSSITGNNWSLAGNAGTDSAINFLGTKDAQPLIFKVNNQKAGKLDFSGATGNTAYGYQSLNSNTGTKNTAIGYSALPQNITGNYNTAVGNVAMLQNTTGNGNTAVGHTALVGNSTGSLNTATGYFSLSSNTTGSLNTGHGHGTLNKNTTGFANTANGYQAMFNNTFGMYNTAGGANSLIKNTTGNFNVAYGDSTLLTNITGSYNTAVGHFADVSVNNLTNATAIGYNAKVAVSNALVLGNNNVNVGIGTSSPQRKLQVYNNGYGITQTNGTVEVGTYVDNTYGWLGTASNHPLALFTNDGDPSVILATNGYFGIGTNAPSANLDVNSTVRFRSLTNGILTADANGNLGTTTLSAINGSNWSLAGNSGTNSANNFIGTTDAQPLIFKVNNQNAGRLENTLFNTSFGYQSLNAVSTGKYNTANGYQALLISNADGNTANGYQSLGNNTSGVNNTAIGTLALKTNGTGGFNTAIGYAADMNTNNLTNATAIGYNAKAAISNSVILGNTTDNVKVGIGTSSPIQRLEVNGGSVYANGESTGFLTDFGNTARVGLIKYAGRGGGIWRTNAQQFEIGRVDASVTSLPGSPASFTTDLYVSGTGQVGVGTTSTTALLDVNGSTRLRGLTTAGVVTTDGSGNLSSVSSASLTTASNGLTQTGTNIALGGMLVQATVINQNSNSLSIVGAGTQTSSGQVSYTLNTTNFKSPQSSASVGQSFTLSQASTITSITINNAYSLASGSVTLNIFSGNGSTATYSQLVTASAGITTYALTTPQYLPAGISRFEFNIGNAPNRIWPYSSSAGSYSGGQLYLDGNVYNNEDLYFIVNYTYQQPAPTLYAAANGNVGIGTTNPIEKLDVSGNIRCVALTQTSDIRFKQNIHPLTDALASIKALQGERYLWNETGITHGGKAGQQQIGLIAQEVEKIYPELVSTDAQGYKAVNYAQLTPVLIEAIKEQQKEIDTTSKQNEDLKKDVETLKAQMKILMDKMTPATGKL